MKNGETKRCSEATHLLWIWCICFIHTSVNARNSQILAYHGRTVDIGSAGVAGRSVAHPRVLLFTCSSLSPPRARMSRSPLKKKVKAGSGAPFFIQLEINQPSGAANAECYFSLSFAFVLIIVLAWRLPSLVLAFFFIILEINIRRESQVSRPRFSVCETFRSPSSSVCERISDHSLRHFMIFRF